MQITQERQQTPYVLTESDMAAFMQLDIIVHITEHVPHDVVQATLKKKLKRTGVPFFDTDEAFSAAQDYMKERTLVIYEGGKREEPITDTC